MTPHVQEQTVKIVEDFFLSRTDGELYTFLQEVLERPLAEKRLAKTHVNQFEAEKIVRSQRSEA